MFSCPHCDRSYDVQSSLNRHLHNHKQGRRHVCQQCHAEFRRKDVLVRHYQVHTVTSDPVDSLQSRSGRRRCIKACDRCRARRTRCDGDVPCQACVKAGSVCYTKERPPRRLASCEPMGSIASSTSGVDMDDETLAEAGVDAITNHGASFLPTSVDSQLTLSSTPLKDSELGQQIPQPGRLHQDTWSSSSLWPWAHEDLYFPSSIRARDIIHPSYPPIRVEARNDGHRPSALCSKAQASFRKSTAQQIVINVLRKVEASYTGDIDVHWAEVSRCKCRKSRGHSL